MGRRNAHTTLYRHCAISLIPRGTAYAEDTSWNIHSLISSDVPLYIPTTVPCVSHPTIIAPRSKSTVCCFFIMFLLFPFLVLFLCGAAATWTTWAFPSLQFDNHEKNTLHNNVSNHICSTDPPSDALKAAHEKLRNRGRVKRRQVADAGPLVVDTYMHFVSTVDQAKYYSASTRATVATNQVPWTPTPPPPPLFPKWTRVFFSRSQQQQQYPSSQSIHP